MPQAFRNGRQAACDNDGLEYFEEWFDEEDWGGCP